jgi:ABC-type phosphate/phosphonate transport system substrate-binding protein
MASFVANARMYAVTPAVEEAWRTLFAWVGRSAGVPLSYLTHAPPAPLEELWRRHDAGAVFMCGYPFAAGRPACRAMAAPVPAPAPYKGQPVYWTDFIVRRESAWGSLADALGGRIGWTAEHSQSGFNAVRHHLLGYRGGRRGGLFGASVGPLVTPRRVIEAVLSEEIDVGPLDSYVHDLLRVHEPATAARLRVVESTAPAPIPLLVASAAVDLAALAALREPLLAAHHAAEMAPVMATLLLERFAVPDVAAYRVLLDQAAAAEVAGYPVPA